MNTTATSGGAAAHRSPEAGNTQSAPPKSGTTFYDVQMARRTAIAEGAVPAVRKLLAEQLQARRAMAEALSTIRLLKGREEATRLLELKELAAAIPADDRLNALEMRLAQLEAAVTEVDEKTAPMVNARLAMRVYDLEKHVGNLPPEDARYWAALKPSDTPPSGGPFPPAAPEDYPPHVPGSHPDERVACSGDVEISIKARAAAIQDGTLVEVAPGVVVDRRTLSTGEAA